MKIALIAFDGIDPRVISKNRKHFSTIDKILDESMWGEWNTPGHTIPSFIATLTGEVYNTVNFHWDEGKGVYQRHRQTEMDFLWDKTDSSMTLLNIPVLYPPEEIHDVMVSGFLTPDDAVESNLARPQEVQEKLNEEDYIHDVHADETFEELGAEGMFKHLGSIMRQRTAISEWLIEKYDSDLFYGTWTSPDRWFHQCHKHDLEHVDMYKMVNKVIENVLKILPDDIPIIFFSDHGFAHYQGDEGVHKGHMYNGWYAVYNSPVPSYRDDSLSIYDLYPTVKNYLDGEVDKNVDGRILFHQEEQNETVKDRLSNLGYFD